MSRKCEICGKGVLGGNRVSHAHNVSKRKWQVNLQTVRVLVEGRSRQLRVCTRCIRSERVVKHAGRTRAAAAGA